MLFSFITGNENRQCAGFTIIEAVLALSVFSIGILALSVIYGDVINNNTNAFIITEAMELSGGYIDGILSLPYSDDSPSSDVIEGSHQYTVTVSETTCSSGGGSCIGNTKDVTLTIMKPDGETYTFKTARAQLRGLP